MKVLHGVLALVIISGLGCGKGPLAPDAPTTPPLPRVETIQYAINIPDRVMAQEFIRQHPDGLAMNPIQAQTIYNYAYAYHGAANVYYGPTAPPQATYYLAGIVIAPVAVAVRDEFPASDWPNEYGQFPANTTMRWLGRFVYTLPGTSR